MTGVVLQTTVTEAGRELLQSAVDYLPRLAGAVAVLLGGWLLGRLVAAVVGRLSYAAQVDEVLLDTPLGRLVGGDVGDVSRLLGELAAWFVYAVALFTAIDLLEIAVLAEWRDTAITYLPAFVAGLVVFAIGLVVADVLVGAIRRADSVTHTRYLDWFADVTRLFLYFTVVVIGLDTMGVDVSILFVFARALAWGMAGAVAIAVGVAFGLGGKEYVAENIDGWTSRAQDSTTESDGTDPDAGADRRESHRP